MIKRPSSSREWKTDQSGAPEEAKIDQDLAKAIDESLANLARKLSILTQKQTDRDA